MLRRQPSSKRAATLFPYATLVRSGRRCPAAWPGPPPQARQSARPRFRHQPAPRPRRLLPPPAACAATSGTGTACRRRVRVPPWSILLRSEEHTSELQSLMRISYAVFRLKKKTIQNHTQYTQPTVAPKKPILTHTH